MKTQEYISRFKDKDELLFTLLRDIEKCKFSKKEAQNIINELKKQGVLSNIPFKKTNGPYSYSSVIETRCNVSKNKYSFEGWYHYIEVSYAVKANRIKRSVIRISGLGIALGSVIGIGIFIASKLLRL